jgi:hypothetical protein
MKASRSKDAGRIDRRGIPISDPVGNNVGYVAGITVAGTMPGRHDTGAAKIAVSAFALMLVGYSAAQLARSRRRGISGQVLAAGRQQASALSEVRAIATAHPMFTAAPDAATERLNQQLRADPQQPARTPN